MNQPASALERKDGDGLAVRSGIGAASADRARRVRAVRLGLWVGDFLSGQDERIGQPSLLKAELEGC